MVVDKYNSQYGRLIRAGGGYFQAADIIRQEMKMPKHKLSDRMITDFMGRMIIDEGLYKIMVRRWRRKGFL